MMLSEISRAKTTTVQYHENVESKLVKPEEKKKRTVKWWLPGVGGGKISSMVYKSTNL